MRRSLLQVLLAGAQRVRPIVSSAAGPIVLGQGSDRCYAAEDGHRPPAGPGPFLFWRAPARYAGGVQLHTGTRVFANRRDALAITDILKAHDGTYPVATTNGGRTWRVDGPVLHIPAAQGAIAVRQAGVAAPRIYFAWCGACNNVIDATPDVEKRWWQAYMPGQVLSLLGTPSAHNGRRWTYSQSMNAVS